MFDQSNDEIKKLLREIVISNNIKSLQDFIIEDRYDINTKLSIVIK